MKILLICNGWQRSLNRETAWGIRHVQSHYLARELSALGHTIVYGKLGPRAMTLQESLDYYRAAEFPTADHCLCAEASGFRNRTFDGTEEIVYRSPCWVTRRVGHCPLLDALHKAVPGAVAAVKDVPVLVGPEDVTFFGLHYPPDVKLMPQCVYLGVAADAEFLTPRQQSNRVTVLLDHPHYTPSKPDDTPAIVDCLRGRGLRALRFGMKVVEELDLDRMDPLERFAGGCSHSQACEAHNVSHVFFTTHRESMGLSVIEAAMAGNLIATRRDHIKPAMLEGLRCYVYDDAPRWDEIEPLIDPGESRRAAMRYDRWPEMARIIESCYLQK